MAGLDHDDWLTTTSGARYWGRHGAAGLLLRAAGQGQPPRFLLAQRASWVHGGCGEWSVPGGARLEHETAQDAALREFREELGAPPEDMVVVASYEDHVAPGEWTYVTLLAETARTVDYSATLSLEHDAARWFTEDELWGAPLFAPFASAWPRLRDLFPGS